jgi:hypothetical protein
MIEARVFTDDIEPVRNLLDQIGAINQGRYVIHDDIYHSNDPSVSLTEEFLRLRVIPENIWDEEPVILALKQTELRQLGKNSHIPLKLQFDEKEEAQVYYETHLKLNFTFDYSFSRIGWQYFLPNGDVVDLEILEDKYPSIEFKSTTDEGIRRLLSMFAIADDAVMKGPSVVAFKDVLEK